jgi:ABC-type polysaccharide/polyol phosphate export permease
MGKEQEDSHKTWNVVTYLVTLMLAGIACTMAGIQWAFGTMKNDLVRALFEPIWSIIVFPLFFMSTVVWNFSRFLVESSDLQESVTKRKDISKRLRLKQTRAEKRQTT